jgi:hypothetical protein
MSDERGEMTPQGMDELASAYLDGEATPQEAALVESDPRLQALVEELRAVREMVTTPVEPPSDEVRDQMIAQALDHRAPVVSLKKARRRLRTISPQARVILAAAAVVVAVAVVGITQFDQASRDGDDMLAGDSEPAAAMADEAPMDAAESAPVDDSEEASAEAFDQAPAEEMMDEEMAIELAEAPMDDSYASDEAAEPEPMMADEGSTMDSPAEAEEELALARPQFDPANRVFDTEDDLVVHIIQMLSEPQEDMDVAVSADAVTCPSPPEEEGELLTQFTAMVEEAEVEVSVFLNADELTITQTSLPPECEALSTRLVIDWAQ